MKGGVLGFCMAAWCLLGCSEPIDDPKCSLNSDCTPGRLCHPEGECQKADPVSIRPVLLDSALLGDGEYSQALEVEGGIAPYAWSLTEQDAKLSWLEIDEVTGELRAKSGRAPGELGKDLKIEVTVRDSSNGGAGQTASRPFDLDVIECRGPEVCWEAEGGVCLEGLRECVEGVLSAECGSKEPSADPNHCGPGCGACGDGGDRCDGGECRCGSRDPCAPGETCCGTGCYDLDTDTGHCGGCDTDCLSETGHAGGVFCDGGECDYVVCEAGYHDCDGSRSNGCETLQDRNNCSGCGDDCTNQSLYPHTENQSCPAGACEYDCESGYGDCAADPPGCETPLHTEENCSACGDACDTPAEPACIETGGGDIRCGCTQDAQCDPDRMCCSTNTCVIHSPQNCESCGHVCTIEDGGLSCVGDAATGWSCGCVDMTGNTDCKGVYGFSRSQCSPGDNQCFCGATVNCSGTVDDMCCVTGTVAGCVDLNTNASNCGVCGRICPSGTCADGACTCGTCPNLAGEAWFCNNGACVCTDLYGTADPEPCPPGQYCCTNKGCCMEECGEAVLEGCSIGCLNEGYVWCRWGCCSDCASETECDQYEPSGFPFYP